MLIAPWKQLAKPDASKEYLAIVTYLPVKHYRTVPSVAKYSQQVDAQLAGTPGLVRYSMGSKPWTKQFWTMSVWEDEAALMAFVFGGAHKDTVARLHTDMGATKFARWKVLGTDVPLTWEVALEKADS
ncbi:MAG: DUF3291 domain-containing protein [Proteobacteria bacterium]|nr:MAG: DUF3291 domain-containing protein [Pseudomonadota bacterium]